MNSRLLPHVRVLFELDTRYTIFDENFVDMLDAIVNRPGGFEENDKGFEPWEVALSHDDEHVRRFAAIVLSVMSSERTREQQRTKERHLPGELEPGQNKLLELFQSGDEKVSSAAAYGLVRSGADGIGHLLYAVLGDVYQAALEAS